MITPWEIQNWLNKIIAKNSFGFENKEYLRRINDSAYQFLEAENQKLDEPFDNDEDYYEHLWTYTLYRDSYWQRTAEAYMYSLQVSALLINTPPSEVSKNLYIDWLNDVNEILDSLATVKKLVSQIVNFKNEKTSGISEDDYTVIRIKLCNSVVEFLNDYYETLDLEGVESGQDLKEPMKKAFAVDSKELFSEIESLDSHIKLREVFTEKDDFTDHFFKCRSDLNSIYKKLNTNKRNAGAAKRIGDDRLIQDITKCIDSETAQTTFGRYHFLTKSGNNVGKIQIGTIASYLLEEELYQNKYSKRQLRRRIKELLEGGKTTGIIKNDGKYFKKGHN
jgi:hypothetical protein